MDGLTLTAYINLFSYFPCLFICPVLKFGKGVVQLKFV